MIGVVTYHHLTAFTYQPIAIVQVNLQLWELVSCNENALLYIYLENH
jgi:hypothetical protein